MPVEIRPTGSGGGVGVGNLMVGPSPTPQPPPSGVPLGGSGAAAARTTATSRRGGLTRSRSPPVVGSRGGSLMAGPPTSASAATTSSSPNGPPSSGNSNNNINGGGVNSSSNNHHPSASSGPGSGAGGSGRIASGGNGPGSDSHRGGMLSSPNPNSGYYLHHPPQPHHHHPHPSSENPSSAAAAAAAAAKAYSSNSGPGAGGPSSGGGGGPSGSGPQRHPWPGESSASARGDDPTYSSSRYGNSGGGSGSSGQHPGHHHHQQQHPQNPYSHYMAPHPYGGNSNSAYESGYGGNSGGSSSRWPSEHDGYAGDSGNSSSSYRRNSRYAPPDFSDGPRPPSSSARYRPSDAPPPYGTDHRSAGLPPPPSYRGRDEPHYSSSSGNSGGRGGMYGDPDSSRSRHGSSYYSDYRYGPRGASDDPYQFRRQPPPTGPPPPGPPPPHVKGPSGPTAPPPPAPPPPGSSLPASSRPSSNPSSDWATAANSGTTSLVIGGTTPIHVPKRSDPVISERSSRAGTAPGYVSSVFRGRPSDSESPGPPTAASPAAAAAAAAAQQQQRLGVSLRGSGSMDLSNSPQKLILPLRTPTSSFEDTSGFGKSPGSKGLKTSGLTLSPENPPAIQNSSHRTRSSDALFETQRTIEGPKNSIELAPSFNLFAQSFDSFGDAHYFHVDSNLQNDSFGMIRTGSIENEGTTQLLQGNSPGRNPSQQYLAPSGSLTIGYSPVNSFGTAVASLSSRRASGNMLLLGGPDGRSASPSQVLGICRSYSGGGGITRLGSIDEGPTLRSGGGSFGGPQPSYHASYAGGGSDGAGNNSNPSSPYYAGPIRSLESLERPPPFYALLCKYKGAFKDCTFLLPGLKAALLEAPSPDPNISIGSDPIGPLSTSAAKSTLVHHGSYHSQGAFGEPSPQDVAVARRRVQSSVCAFGGNLNSERTTQNPDRSSIFREKDTSDKDKTAMVTPSSTVSTAGNQFHSRSRRKYEEALPGRYYENESRLSWEFEESPPIESPGEDDMDGDKSERGGSPKHDDDSKEDKSKGEGDDMCKNVGDGESVGNRPGSSSPQPKMRYRCKLCGQPKQNHRCPYQQSLARSIGIIVFPAVNAFTAAEPGSLAAPLSEMNNFIDVQKDSLSTDTTPNRPTPDRIRRPPGGLAMTTSTQVTPESMRSSPRLHSPASFISSPTARVNHRNRISRQKKRLFSQLSGGAEEQGDLLFVDAMDLKPEQYRIVSKSRISREAYNYPALPLPYAQRKRLSDNLFSLSNEVPKLTDECAQVLREAREKDMWDLAVSELMTQVIVIIHCPDGDSRFEGLRQYLLTLGIAC